MLHAAFARYLHDGEMVSQKYEHIRTRDIYVHETYLLVACYCAPKGRSARILISLVPSLLSPEAHGRGEGGVLSTQKETHLVAQSSST